jgi:hypothetical protein
MMVILVPRNDVAGYRAFGQIRVLLVLLSNLVNWINTMLHDLYVLPCGSFDCIVFVRFVLHRLRVIHLTASPSCDSFYVAFTRLSGFLDSLFVGSFLYGQRR